MRFEIDGTEIYSSTGGREHKTGQPYLFFLHGAGHSHFDWSQQSRSFAYGGYNVMAIDFPGHGLSGGDPLPSVESQADWLVKVMQALNISSASFVGHSQGGLVCLEMASGHPQLVDKAIFVATAGAIPVNDMLISSAENTEPKAKEAMTSWGLGPDAHHYENSVPGFSHVGLGLRIMDRNPAGAVANDLKACAGYEGGLDKAVKVSCPTMCVLGGKDRMTPVKFGMKLAEALPDNTLHILQDSGHTIPTEKPHELNAYLRAFLAA